ncbi:MAG: hypothetical protein U0168_04710 [Nannocystaceae bacterium]|jgi:hypothetical protein
MRRHRSILSAFTLLCALTTACDSKSADDKSADAKKSDGKSGDAKAGDAKPAVAKKAWLEVDKFGVQLEVPEGATVMDGAGTSVMISGPDGGCTVMLAKKDDMSFFQSYDATIAEIDKGQMGKKKEMLENKKTDDSNWTIYYTKESMTDPSKTQYAVDVRKKVGEAEYSCARVEDQEADAKCVLEACASLKAG